MGKAFCGVPAAEVVLWLSVHTDAGSGRLWTRTMPTAYAPEPGDKIMVLCDEEEPEGRVSMRVRSRWWSIDGTLNVEVETVRIDPGEWWQRAGWKHESAWYTDRDGNNFEPQLAESGWERL